MKSRIQKTCLFILSAALLLSMIIGTGALAKGYDYTIRIYAGNQGTIDGKQEISVSVPRGGTYVLDVDELNIKLTNSKYYVKGLKPAGHEADTDNLIVSQTLRVNEDQQYVVIYGIKKNLVSYTVRYMDANNKVLLPQATYYGLVGEKPVISFRYVEGYQPTAYNETKTLVSKESDNVFTFRYTPVKTETVVVNQTNNSTDNRTAGNTQTANTTGNANTSQTGSADNNRVDLTANQTPDNRSAANQAASNPETRELVDLDDEEVPLASGEEIQDLADKSDKEEASSSQQGLLHTLLTPRYLIIAATSLALLAILIGLIVSKRKKQKAE